LDAVVEHGEEVVGDDAFDGVAVAVAEADPEAVEFGAAEEGFALGLEVVGELADEIDGADVGEGDFFVCAVGSEEVDGVSLTEAAGVEIAAERRLVGKDKNDLLVGRGWGSVFQRDQFVRELKGQNLRIVKMYVMLSAFYLSTHCFH
jgi:hypothetical protein